MRIAAQSGIIFRMIYRFIDDKGTFVVENPHKYDLYLPLANRDGTLLSSISPNLGGDIKRDNNHFLTPPASIEDVKNNLLCRRDFFIRTDREVIRLSHPHNDILEAGFLYQKLIKKAGALHIEALNFIPHDMPVEVMHIKVINKGKKGINITPTSFIPLYGRAENNLRDHRHVSSLLNRVELDKYGIILKPTMIFDERRHKVNPTHYFVLGYEDNKRPPVGQFPTISRFCGEGDLISPDAVKKNLNPFDKKLAEFDGKESCGALRFRQRRLKPGEEADYFLITGIDESRRGINGAFLKLNSPAKIKDSFMKTKKYWLKYLSKLEFDFKDRDFNGWLLWVKMQPTLRKLFGNSFLPHYDYGKGGRGWRDLWQDALTLLLTEPDKAKDFILNNFKGVRIDGSNATVITRDGHFIGDRNRISRVWMDHGVWPYLTARLYIHKTGDVACLLKEAPYFRDYQLRRSREIDAAFSQKDNLLRDKKGVIYKGTVLEHILIQNLVQFFNVGEHNIIRLENADWDDGLDMAPERGESVTFSFMYAHNLRDLCFMLNKLKEKKKSVAILKEIAILLDRRHSSVNYLHYKDKQKRLDEYLEKTKNISGEKVTVDIDDLISDLRHKSDHMFTWLRDKEWLKEGFFNGYYDNKGRRAEGRHGNDIRMKLHAQVFAIMSGVASDEQIRKIWASINKYLRSKKFGGFRLNTDFKNVYMELGRAFGFSYGDKENGAFFNHMVVMLANALYQRGFIREGNEVMDSIYKMATSNDAKIYPMIPEYFNNEGRGLYFYLTGSASWYIYTLMEEVLGIKFDFGKISLEPNLRHSNFFNDSIEARFAWRGKTVKAIFPRHGRPRLK